VSKYLLLALIVVTPAFAQGQAAAPRTAAGSGAANVKFDVKTNKKQHTVAQPEPGKALVYVIVQEISDPHAMQIGDVTTRVGLDGNWVGANYGRSYISFAVEPGEHHICTDWQSRLKAAEKLSGAAELTAEAGKTYYYRAELTMPWEQHNADLRLKAVDDAEGLLLISKSAMSTWKAKK